METTDSVAGKLAGRGVLAVLACVLLCGCRATSAESRPGVAESRPGSLATDAVGIRHMPVTTWIGSGSYAVVVSMKTYDDPQWRQVVEALQEKHGASVIVYPYCVWEARGELAGIFPRYACFVAHPNEAGRDFVVAVHRLTRTLDTDPYTDVIWGILTGYDAADALRIARHKEPLTVRRGAAGTALDLALFDEGVWYSESEKNAMWEKRAGGKAEKNNAPTTPPPHWWTC